MKRFGFSFQNRSSSQTARLLLERGADPRVVDLAGNTALHYASDPLLVKALIQAGAAVNVTNQGGLTPLHVTITRAGPSSRHEIIQMLVDAGCHLDQPTPLGNNSPWSSTVPAVETLKINLD